jgi:hypothetical protein
MVVPFSMSFLVLVGSMGSMPHMRRIPPQKGILSMNLLARAVILDITLSSALRLNSRQNPKILCGWKVNRHFDYSSIGSS